MKKLILFILVNSLIKCSLISQSYQNFDLSPLSEKEIIRLNIPIILSDTLSVDLLDNFQLVKAPNDFILKLLKIEVVDQPVELLPSIMTSQDSLKAYDFFFLGKKKYKVSYPVKSYFIIRTQSDDYPLSRIDYSDYHVQVFSLNFVDNKLKSIILIGEEYLSDPYINTSMKTSFFGNEKLEYYINTIFLDHSPNGDFSSRTTFIIDKKGGVSVKN